MTYDFVIVPAGRYRDAFEAIDDVRTLDGEAVTEGPMVALQADLERFAGPDGFLEWPPIATAEEMTLHSSYADPRAQLRLIADAAARHGLATLDLQRPALLDPAGAVALALATDGGPETSWISPQLLGFVLDEISEGRYPWATIAAGDQVYAQTYRNDDGQWDVEHRAGSADAHFTAAATGRDVVERVLWNWVSDQGEDAAWRTMVDWEPLTF